MSDDVTVLLKNDVTHLAARPRTPSAPTPSGSTSQTGWLTSSGSIDHGRFGPGMVLDNRYRVLGLLGRGGMGEVYRADDLRLGQQVALKFLPTDLSRDPIRLAQFHNEVRTARHVSHPNVCRVYDVGEFDGQLFITMEYVDGEDLAILLRRIGRLPEDKGLEIARQICAGLAAAHERGVLHRDLKPANIMLDGAGKVRIMDFSLAAVGEVTDVRAGTPAYMAPEQLAGREVTVAERHLRAGSRPLRDLHRPPRLRSQDAHRADRTASVRHDHGADRRSSRRWIRPSSRRSCGVSTASPRAVRRRPSACRRRSPAAIRLRRRSRRGKLRRRKWSRPPAATVPWSRRSRVCCGWRRSSPRSSPLSALAGRHTIVGRVALAKPAAVLADRAEELRQSLGFVEPVGDRASGFAYDDAYLRWAAEQSTGASRWASLPVGRPAALRFWYRTSPRPLLPLGKGNPVNPGDPALQLHGMTTTVLDTKGRLLRFESAPAQVEAAAASSPPHVDWAKLFAAAGLDMAAFVEAAPSRTPSTYADERKAWTGTLPETTIPVTIEAAGYRGRPVFYDIVTPWAPAAREPGTSPRRGGNNPIFIYVLLGRRRATPPGATSVAAAPTWPVPSGSRPSPSS